ncbi:hypothetical protein, partial [Rhodococcus opacus]|uniref:hypothetical protein n=1 Tax=Rhodococcus opacus TaxID=37919 RepID=UPI001B34DA9C
MVDSIIALSRASPALPIEPAMPDSVSPSTNTREVYWAGSTGRCNTSITEVCNGIQQQADVSGAGGCQAAVGGGQGIA